MNLPYLAFSDKKGKIYHHPYLRMSVASLDKVTIPKQDELIKMPSGSTLFYLPQRQAIGFDPKEEKFQVLDKFEGQEVFAVSAFPIPAFLRLHNPACIAKTKEIFPLWAYTACGYYRGNFYIAAKRIDKRVRQSPRFYDTKIIDKQVKLFLKKYPSNRLYKHLANCALNYNCLAAKNLFLQRWEAPLPTARACNARCLGCLSYQESDCISSQQRINFKPKIDEIAEVMINHLKVAREAIVSFGQGCEGEPLLESDLISNSIIKVRENTNRGTINMNTNASIPKKIETLCKAGIDSFRVSMNSPDEKFYNSYFRPKGYKFSDIMKSIAMAKKYNKFVSINLFIFPGFSDSSKQIKSLVNFIKNNDIDMIQWRNLNIDPNYYMDHISHKGLKPQGVLYLVERIKNQFPDLKHGYFNLSKKSF
ncbi:MAG: radical SAM protein [Candidatus Susulua stagnicola]|nr:radical SAM protein [Candidatus Susulua stagnicola]